MAGRVRELRRLTVCFIAVAWACAPILGVSEDELPLLRTDRGEYAPVLTGDWLGLAVPYEFINRTNVTVYVGGCKGVIAPAFDRLEDGNWVRAHSPFVQGCGAEPTAVSPGGELSDTAEAGWHVPADVTSAEAFVPGEYRLRWWQAGTRSFANRRELGEDTLPVELSVSNTFRIVEPE